MVGVAPLLPVGGGEGLSFGARHNLGDIPVIVRVLRRSWVVLVSSVGVVGWSLVENCTVDASILFSVVKLSRANGGCLGTRSR